MFHCSFVRSFVSLTRRFAQPIFRVRKIPVARFARIDEIRAGRRTDKSDMNPVKLRFYTERYEKEKKYFRLQEKFVAIARTKPLTGKFYAKHDAIPASEVRREYVDLISKRLVLTPKDIYAFKPPTVNMEYALEIHATSGNINDCDFVGMAGSRNP